MYLDLMIPMFALRGRQTRHRDQTMAMDFRWATGFWVVRHLLCEKVGQSLPSCIGQFRRTANLEWIGVVDRLQQNRGHRATP
eukprot:scaffold2000_cov48-Attheya_sp.AAC.1